MHAAAAAAIVSAPGACCFGAHGGDAATCPEATCLCSVPAQALLARSGGGAGAGWAVVAWVRIEEDDEDDEDEDVETTAVDRRADACGAAGANDSGGGDDGGCSVVLFAIDGPSGQSRASAPSASVSPEAAQPLSSPTRGVSSLRVVLTLARAPAESCAAGSPMPVRRLHALRGAHTPDEARPAQRVESPRGAHVVVATTVRMSLNVPAQHGGRSRRAVLASAAAGAASNVQGALSALKGRAGSFLFGRKESGVGSCAGAPAADAAAADSDGCAEDEDTHDEGVAAADGSAAPSASAATAASGAAEASAVTRAASEKATCLTAEVVIPPALSLIHI